MFWCSARASHPCQDHDLFGPTALCSPLLLDGEVAARHNECIRWPDGQVARLSGGQMLAPLFGSHCTLWSWPALGIFGNIWKGYSGSHTVLFILTLVEIGFEKRFSGHILLFVVWSKLSVAKTPKDGNYRTGICFRLIVVKKMLLVNRVQR